MLVSQPETSLPLLTPPFLNTTFFPQNAYNFSQENEETVEDPEKWATEILDTHIYIYI